jgi:hypothetical protein
MRSRAIVAWACLFAVAGACSESAAPLGSGNDVVVDVDAAEQPPPQQGDDDSGMIDSPFAPVDSPYSSQKPDGYAPFDWCTQCGCPSGMFCFGGGTGYTAFNGDCHADGGPVPATGAGLAVGCYPFPGACANEPSCECLIIAMSQYMTCYPVCSITSNIVYCPNP